jgi:hypothetical protein
MRMKNHRGRGRLLIVLTGAVVSLSCAHNHPPAGPGITRIWAVDDGEKVRQDDLNHWAAASPNNAVWDGSSIRLFGARNETVAFQVILEAAGSGARNVGLTLDSLRSGNSVITNTVRSDDLFDYVGRRIEFFVEHYQRVTQRSVAQGFWLDEARPLPDERHLGSIPDALVPFGARNKKPAHGQGGAPFNIQGGKNQAVWVDIYIPRDAKPGQYTGTIRVLENDSLSQAIPVRLVVHAFTLPDTTHQRTFVHWTSEILTNRYGIALDSPAYWAMFRKFMNLAHRHRVDLTDGRRSLEGSRGFAVNLGGYYTGAFYGPHRRYEGPGKGVGNQVYSIGTYDQPSTGYISGFFPDTREAWWKAADQWERWFSTHAPGVFRFKYMDDEADVTNPVVVQAILRKCGWITSSPGPGKSLHRFFTKEFVYDGFFGAIDVWALSAYPGILTGILGERKQRFGECFCVYNGTRPMWGHMETIDNFATDNRVNPWIARKYGVDLIFYWATGFYAEDRPPHPNAVNVWANNYIPGGRPYGSTKNWGAGMLLYPGRDVCYPTDDRGVDGPIACIRLKNFRRGLQDAEYLWLAEQAGIPVKDIVDSIVPHALDDWGPTVYTNPPGFRQQPAFPTEGFVYDRARRALADSLDARSIRQTGSQ